MYAIVKTGGKQYKVALGDKLNVEKLPAEAGDTVELQTICTVDGKDVVADPEKAAGTKVVAKVLNQFKDKKVIVFKFKKRKNYKRKKGHRQNLTRIQIVQIGSEKFKEPTKAASKKKEAPAKDDAEKAEKKPAAKKTAEKKPAAKKATTAKKTTSKPAKKDADAAESKSE
ncbi:MAG: 50S ribosomal protein L21 [Eggerthellaceae bacterium]|nr:50S ribosomal protein L21 [Eggerthellaceae bacterium]